jgi:hypothetical protein
VSGFVSGIIKDRSAKVFRASKAEPSSTKRETQRRRSEWDKPNAIVKNLICLGVTAQS